MALLPTESWRSGFVIDTASGAVVMTTDASQATFQGGFVRDPDGRLVAVEG